MASEKLEYDSALGGSVVLPDGITTYRFAAERLNEMKTLMNNIKDPANTKLKFQSLPNRMRRRAMSHHPKRLPRRYRAIHQSQMLKAGKPRQTKRPSRKYRRKASNLLKEYIRRQRKHVWLETHIWHAKRFHMAEKWGYKLPVSSCDKTYRACYRATSEHCLLQDISYFGCIQIVGTLQDIYNGFAQITNSRCGLGVASNAFTTGKREGQIDLFKKNQYPRKALGRVSFLWKPKSSILELTRTMWIFVHASAYQEIVTEMIDVFNLVSTKVQKIPYDEDPNETESMGTSDTSDQPKEEIGKKFRQQKFITKNFAYIRAPLYVNNENSLTLTELKDTVNRFRLTGPLAQSVLAHAFKCKNPTDFETNHWYKEYMSSDKNSAAHRKQSQFWSNAKYITSPGVLIPNMIIGLNIEDPRINRPDKRTKAVPDDNFDVDEQIFVELHDEYSQSAIWDSDIRNKISETMMSTHEFCSLRNQNSLVPGERCAFENDMQPVPVLLIQRPGSQNNNFKRLGFGCGWDVIIPSGYGLTAWLSFIMWGARPGGLREMKSLSRECGYDQFLPDTISGLKESAEKYQQLQSKYFRLPPNKRPNFRKLAICSPFKCQFPQLIREWGVNTYSNEKDCGFYVLRERETLMLIQNSMQRNFNLPNLPNDCLIPVYFKMKTRGNPGDFSVICLPKFKDIKLNLKKLRKSNHEPVVIEPIQNDDKENERKTLRLEHKKLLKRLRGRRVRAKRKLQETSEKRVRIRPAGNSVIISEQFKKMCELWLPTKPESIRHQCLREVIGYVTQSEFSFTEATVTAIGYVTTPGLRKLLGICGRYEKMALIRGPKTRNYRFATFKINCCI